MLSIPGKVRALGAALLAAAALAACGGAATTTPTSGGAPATAPAAGAPTTAATASQPTAAASAPATAATGQTATATKLNLNTVTEDQLLSTIPGFSNRMVREFMEYRPYVSIQQFRKEIGKYVSAEQVAAYEQYVYVPVSVNEADAATLRQLPGVDESAAEALIAGRPYASNQAFLDKLAAAAPAADAQQAAAYLASQ